MSKIELPVICGECGHRHTHFVTQEQLDSLGTPRPEEMESESLLIAARADRRRLAFALLTGDDSPENRAFAKAIVDEALLPQPHDSPK